MPTKINQLLAHAVRTALQPQAGETLTLPNGKTFTGIVESVGVIDPDMPLGPDVREEHRIHCLEPAPELESQEVVRLADGQKLKVVGREDSCAHPFVVFRAVKVAEGKDA